MNIGKADIIDLNELIKKLEEYRKELINIDYVHDKKKFFKIMKNLRKFLLSVENKHLYETLLHSKYYKFYKDYFSNINIYYLRSIESVQSLSIMTKGFHNFDSFSDLMDKEIIQQSFKTKGNEIKYLDFSKAKTLVMVGSGPFPETLLYIYENTNIDNIIGVDYNHEAIFMAGEMISGLNLDKITFHQGNGTEYDYSKVDIVYMPLFTYPKEKILDRIVKTGKDSIQILIAIPKGLGNLLFEGLGDINNRLKVINREDASTPYIAQEVLILEKYNF